MLHDSGVVLSKVLIFIIAAQMVSGVAIGLT